MMSPRLCPRWMLPLAIVIAGIAWAETPPPNALTVPRTLDVPDGALVAAGKAPELELLYTGDVIGFLEPCG